MTHDDYFGFDKIHKVEVLRFRDFGHEGGADPAREELLSIMGNEPEGLAKRKQTVDNLAWWVQRLRFFPYILFGFGVIVTAIITVSSS